MFPAWVETKGLNSFAFFSYIQLQTWLNVFVNFLFNSIVVYSAEQAKYRVSEFKLHPGKYHAQLITINGGNNVKEVTFWKEGNKWKYLPSTTNAKYVVEVIAKDLDRLRNRGWLRCRVESASVGGYCLKQQMSYFLFE